MAEDKEEVVVKISLDGEEKSATEVEKLEQKMKELQNETVKAQQQFGQFSPQAIKAAKEFQKVKDQIENAEQLAARFADGARFNALAGSVGAVANGFAAAQGAIALFGSESEDVEKALLKVNAAMAFAQGLNGLKEAQNNFKALAGQIRGGVASSFSTLKGAIISTGIGALVVLVGALIANWDSVKASLEKSFPSLKESGGLFNKIKEIAFGLGNVLKEYVLGPIRAITKIFQGEFKGAIQEIKNGFSVVKNFQKGAEEGRAAIAEEARKKRIEGEIKAGEQELQVMKARGENTLKLERELSLKRQDILSSDPEKLLEEQTKLRVLNAAEEKRVADEQKKLADERKKKAEEENKRRQEEAKARKEEEKKLQRDLSDELQKRNADDFGKELLELSKHYEDKKRIIEKANGDVSQLNNLFLQQRADLEKKYAELAIKQEEERTKSAIEAALKRDEEIARGNEIAKKESEDYVNKLKEELKSIVENEGFSNEERAQKLEDFGRKRIELEDLNESEATEISKSYSEARVQIQSKENEARSALAEGLSSVVSQYASLAGEQTAIGKGLAVASTTIDTYQSASKTYAALVGVGGPLGPVLATAGAAAAIASGLKRVRDIVAVKVPGGKGNVSAPSISNATAGVAASNATQQAQGISLNSDSINAIGDKSVKSYVLQSDVATESGKAARVERTASI